MKIIGVVSDDQTMLEMMQVGLVLEGYEVQAIMIQNYRFLQEGQLPDLIIVDVCMHEEQGEWLCRRWKTTEQTKRIPLLFLSNHRYQIQTHEATLATDFLRKPFHLLELFRMVKKYILLGSSS